jgi:hypothetical protein
MTDAKIGPVELFRMTVKDHADIEQEEVWDMIRDVERLVELRKAIRQDREALMKLENEADFLRNRIYMARREFKALADSMRAGK